MGIITSLTLFSALSFLYFGIACFSSTQMKAEYTRYGLAKFRTVVGGLQLLGAAGLIVGYIYDPVIHAMSAGGLTVLMILGFIVRLRIRDNFFQSAPSLLYAVLNTIIFLLVSEVV